MTYCGSSHTHSFQMNEIGANMKDEIKEKIKKIRRSGTFNFLIYREKIDYIVYNTNDPDESGIEFAKRMGKDIALAISTIC